VGQRLWIAKIPDGILTWDRSAGSYRQFRPNKSFKPNPLRGFVLNDSAAPLSRLTDSWRVGVRRRMKLMDAHSTTSKSQSPLRPVVAALLLGFVTTAVTYGAALACAAAQLHSAVVIFAWPTFALTGLLPAGEAVTSDSPENPWPALASVALAWLIYSALWYLWLGRRRSVSAA
jgi:hypothetical protein